MSYFEDFFGGTNLSYQQNWTGKESSGKSTESSGLRNVDDLLNFIKVVDPLGEETREIEAAIRESWAHDQELYAARAAVERTNTIDIDYEEVA